jgi:hypothetical protein
MIVSAHQPSYFPWLGLLDKIAKSDLYILLDEVQLADRAYQHRNIFSNTEQQIKYLTVPILKKGYRSKSIKELKTSGSQWQKKHRSFLILNYNKAPYFEQIYGQIEAIFRKKYVYLIDVLLDSMAASFELFKIETPIELQSVIPHDKTARKTSLILSLVQSMQASVYLSGTGARAYLSLRDFKKRNIEVKFNDFKSFSYPQHHFRQGNFHEGLSCLDMLFNLGIENSRKLFWHNAGIRN